MGSTGDFDFNENLPTVIFALFLGVGIFQLVINGLYAIYVYFTKNVENTAITDESNFSLPIYNYIMSVFRYSLLIIYLFVLFSLVSNRISVFYQSDFDQYLTTFKTLFFEQLKMLGCASLLWIFATTEMRQWINWGFLILGFSILALTGLDIYHLPMYHWVQIIELLIPRFLLLIIPTIGFFIFKFLNKLPKSKLLNNE